MVLVAGQYDVGGLGRASLHDCAADASKLSLGGSAGENGLYKLWFSYAAERRQ